MPSREYFLERIEHEFSVARAARRQGNSGKVRVCARRAAGEAISWYLTRYPKQGWGTDAVTRLNRLKEDPSFSMEAREAAERLTKRISERFEYESSGDPMKDADIIIHHIKEVMSQDVD